MTRRSRPSRVRRSRKFQLCDANGNNLSSSSIVVHATGITKVDNTASGVLDDSGSANPDYDFRYDPTLGGYIYNLSTKSLTTGTWKVAFTVGGDSEPGYLLQFDVR
jgi:hypothetical protein